MFVLLQSLHIFLRWPAVFLNELFILFDNQIQLFPNPLERREVKGNEVKTPLSQLIGIEHLGGESEVTLNN